MEACSTMRLKQAHSPAPALNDNQPQLVDSTFLSNATADLGTDGFPATETARRHRDTLQWCNTINTIQHQHRQNEQQSDNFQQQNQQRQLQQKQQQQQQQQPRPLYNINNNLAAREPRARPAGTLSSLCSESSPDDSLLDYEDAQQSCSSVDTSPQDEDRGFDLSDSESLSDDGNLSGERLQGHRGIVNPNYPGFQHLAHTLDYTIKTCSDTDFTDDDLDLDQVTARHGADANALNNNNNNNEDQVEYKIDSVNRLDSVENIQKVFYDKPKLNLPFECPDDEEKRNNCLDSADEAGTSNVASDEDADGNLFPDSSESSDVKFNIVESCSRHNIAGELGKARKSSATTLASPSQPKDSLAGFTQVVQLQHDLKFSKVNPARNGRNIVIGSVNEIAKDILDTAARGRSDKTSESKTKVAASDPVNIVENPEPQEPIVTNVPPADTELKINNITQLNTVPHEARDEPAATNEDCSGQSNGNATCEPPAEQELATLEQQSIDPSGAASVNQTEPSETIPSISEQSADLLNGTNSTQHTPTKPASTLTAESNVPPESPSKDPQSQNRKDIAREITQILNHSLETALSKKLTRGVEQDLEEAVEKLNLSKDLSPSALRYTIEPNSSQPFEKVKVEIHRSLPADTICLMSDSNMRNSTEKLNSSDAFLSGAKETIEPEYVKEEAAPTDAEPTKLIPHQIPDNEKSAKMVTFPKTEVKTAVNVKLSKEEKTKNDKEKDDDSMVPRKNEKIEINYVKKKRDMNQQYGSLVTIPRRELGGKNRETLMNRRSLPVARNKKRTTSEALDGFDVYNIETAMPKIDLDAIESHLRAARDEERRRRTDREEIRRRLAMGSEDDYYNGCDRPGRKPSLQARLQSGMNLQICFMNETASDTESPNSDSECPVTEKKASTPPVKNKLHTPPLKPVVSQRPVSLPLGTTQPFLKPFTQPLTEADFFARQARLQTEARMALAQAKEMAHMQMEIERQRQKKSPITEMVRSSLEKVGIPFPEERRRVSRQILTEMNLAQLQVIVNDLHTQIETLNENLVRFLMDRDDLHMEQDSMLVDIEDLTRYLGAKEQTVKEQKLSSQNNNIPPPSPAPASPLSAINNTVKPRLHRIASLVKK